MLHAGWSDTRAAHEVSGAHTQTPLTSCAAPCRARSKRGTRANAAYFVRGSLVSLLAAGGMSGQRFCYDGEGRASSRASGAGRDLGKPTMSQLLIVDDEEAVCWALKKALTKLGHRVAVAASAEEGLRLARKETPDAIVLDVRLQIGRAHV